MWTRLRNVDQVGLRHERWLFDVQRRWSLQGVSNGVAVR